MHAINTVHLVDQGASESESRIHRGKKTRLLSHYVYEANYRSIRNNVFDQTLHCFSLVKALLPSILHLNQVSQRRFSYPSFPILVKVVLELSP